MANKDVYNIQKVFFWGGGYFYETPCKTKRNRNGVDEQDVLICSQVQAVDSLERTNKDKLNR